MAKSWRGNCCVNNCDWCRPGQNFIKMNCKPIGNWPFRVKTLTKSVHCEVAMYRDVKKVMPMPDYRIYVEIEDGRKGIFDLKPYLERGVFRELTDVHYFNRVSVLFGAVTWPNEQDIAPETLLAEIIPFDRNA